MTMTLSGEARRTLDEHVRRELPREACGLLIGRIESGDVVAVAAVPARNAAPGHALFELDPRALLAADAQAQERSCEIVAIYHSHPDGNAVPSPRDVAECDPAWAMLIVGAGGETRAWRVDPSRSRAIEEGIA
jgi:proteasome lid subunit RPN8/RPN11